MNYAELTCILYMSRSTWSTSNIQHPTLTYIDIIPVIPAIFTPRVLRFVDRHDSTTFTAAGTEPSAPGNSGAAGSARDVAAETGVSHQTCLGPLSIVCIMDVYIYIYICMYICVYLYIYIYWLFDFVSLYPGHIQVNRAVHYIHGHIYIYNSVYYILYTYSIFMYMCI